jgi:PIN domain nuclease of toxin-antitoxin system
MCCVKLLLDTHVWVRWLSADQPLAPPQIELIEEAEHLFVSAVSCWEVAYLAKRGRLILPLPMREWLYAALQGSGVETIPLSSDIGVTAAELPDIHRDPADRFIIATALVFDCRLVSFDGQFAKYEGLKGKLIS